MLHKADTDAQRQVQICVSVCPYIFRHCTICPLFGNACNMFVVLGGRDMDPEIRITKKSRKMQIKVQVVGKCKVKKFL